MHPSLSTSYLLPAIFLNPVLFLHGFNTILSRIIPPVVVAGAVSPPPYSTFGPSANHPHLDVHASDNLCWSYTLVMICAQLMAFGRIHRLREEGKERKRLKNESEEAWKIKALDKGASMANGHATISGSLFNGKVIGEASHECPEQADESQQGPESTDRYSRDVSEESEVIL
ncbi:MAG: hypothetical protein Q9218_001799 [Villophora microphyllina]